MDTTGHILTWNQGAERNKGYTADEIIGKHFSVFYSQDDIDAGKPEHELRIATRLGRIEDEDWRIRKDGTRFWANVVITALHDDSGDLVGFAKVTRNLTTRKQQEDEVRRANTRLKQQQAELRELNDAKDEFVSLASHQLRTPATAVKMVLGSVLDGLYGPIDPDIRAVIAKAYTSNERQIDIVNSLLKVAQVDSGKIVLKRNLLDLSAIAADVADEHRDAVAERGQSLTLDVPDEPAEVHVDGQNFQMALSNLVDNASKYSPAGSGIVVSVRVTADEARVAVSDEGVGIAPEDLPQLFAKFQRFQNHISAKVPGTGLGLYWARRIIDMHGGSIQVASRAGQGTTFTLVLPTGSAHA